MHRTVRVVLVAGCIVPLMLCGACKHPLPKAAQASWSVARYPRAADRLIGLVRRQLSDANPVRTEQEVICETERLAAALGYEEASARVRGALDTAYRDRRDSLALERVGRMLGGQALGTGDGVCDSLNAAANREDHIVSPRTAVP
jgi:hypothetical protein